MEDKNPSEQIFIESRFSHKPSLPQMTSERIRALIYDGKLPPESQLPSEPELAKMMSVSRGTIRTALDILQHEGFLWRRQGVGTFVTTIPQMMNRLDMNLGVTDLIKSFGLLPGCREIELKIEPASKTIAKKLCISSKDPVICIHRIRTASNTLVAATKDIFPQKIILPGSSSVELEEFDLENLKNWIDKEQSIYRVLENHFQIIIEYGIAELSPIAADAELIEQFNLDVKVGTVMLYLEQIDYNKDQHPIMLSYEYHMANTSRFSVYRRRR